jgi:rubrerythrin
MIFEHHLAAAERNAWPLEDGIDWGGIDIDIARSETDILDSLHDAALIEGYLPLFVPRLMRIVWDDVDATAILSVELYEGLRHFTALKRYLDRAGHTPEAAMETTLVEARRGAVDLELDPANLLAHLTNFMCSELLAARFFRMHSRRTREPVLKALLTHMARDEYRHCAGAADLLRKRIEQDPTAVGPILAAAEHFRHYGSDVVAVPVAESNDFQSVLAVNRKVRQICGTAPTEHIKEGLRNAAL